MENAVGGVAFTAIPLGGLQRAELDAIRRSVDQPLAHQQQHVRPILRLADEPAHDAVRIALRVLADGGRSTVTSSFAFRSGARKRLPEVSGAFYFYLCPITFALSASC